MFEEFCVGTHGRPPWCVALDRSRSARRDYQSTIPKELAFAANEGFAIRLDHERCQTVPRIVRSRFKGVRRRMESTLTQNIVGLLGPRMLAVVFVVVALASQVQQAQAQPTSQPRRTNLLVTASSVSDLAIGTSCALTIEAAAVGSFNCRVRIECAGRVVYGAGTSGFNMCHVERDGALAVRDSRSDDGDPALSLVDRGGAVTISVSTDTWRMALSTAPVQTVGVPAGVVPSTAIAPGARQVRVSDCLVQDQQGVVSVRCGAVSARCSRAARLDAHSDSDPHGAQVALEAHSCPLGDRAVVAVVLDRAGTRQVQGVAPLSDRPSTPRLQRVQGAELVVTAPLGALPVDPNALHGGTGQMRGCRGVGQPQIASQQVDALLPT